MPKPATGTTIVIDGVARAVVTIAGKTRRTFVMPGCRPGPEAEERTRLLAALAKRLRAAHVTLDRTERALEMVAGATARSLPNALAVVGELVEGELGLVGVEGAPTFRDIGKRWTDGELAKEYPDQIRVKRSVSDDKARLERYVYPLLGDTPIDRVTLDHCEAIMRALPSTLAPATRRNVGQLVTRILRMAVYPLRLIPASPIPEGFLPSTGTPKALAYLYPDEDRRLLACEAVPLEYRLLWGFLAREGMRAGEARALTWGDVDLERGAIRLDQNKTDDPRAWALDQGVRLALELYRVTHRAGDASSALVFRGLNDNRLRADGLAKRLLSHLKATGLDKDRPELFTSTASRRQIRVHDLRGTFVTLSLANGRSEAWISDRTGHRSSAMINRYKRTARTVDELGLGQLAPLWQAIPELVCAFEVKREQAARSPSIPLQNNFAPGTLSVPGASAVTPTGFETDTTDPQVPDTQALRAVGEAAEQRSEPLDRADGESPGDPERPDLVEVALAEALSKAAAAEQWAAVEALTQELRTRREARAGVVDLAAERAKRNGGDR